MSKDTGKKPQTNSEPKTSDRLPADKFVVQFLQANKIVLLLDKVALVNSDIKDAVVVVYERPRLRAFYLDELKDKLGEKAPKSPVSIVN